jgi:hypothetical protein
VKGNSSGGEAEAANGSAVNIIRSIGINNGSMDNTGSGGTHAHGISNDQGHVHDLETLAEHNHGLDISLGKRFLTVFIMKII